MEQRTPTLRSVGWLWFGIAVAVIVVGFRQAIFLTPTDAAQGDAGRIFYYHVPTAMLSLIFPYINFAASLFYLYWRRRDPLKALTADAMALATAEVTVVYSSICLLTGMLWARAVWGIWWTWDARLTTTLVLWLIYVSYLLLRRFAAGPQMQTLAAVCITWGFFHASLHPHQVIAAIVLIAAIAMVHHIQQQVEPHNLSLSK